MADQPASPVPAPVPPVVEVVELNTEMRTILVVEQTQLALDRTQLAWVRTGFTFITAGFAIDKALEALHRARVLAGTNWVDRDHFIGLLLTSTATVCTLLVTVTYVRHYRALNRLKTQYREPWPPVLPISVVVLALGLGLFTLLLDLG